jgi:hypothetical protein
MNNKNTTYSLSDAEMKIINDALLKVINTKGKKALRKLVRPRPRLERPI